VDQIYVAQDRDYWYCPLNTVDQIYVAQDRDHWHCPLKKRVGGIKYGEFVDKLSKSFFLEWGNVL
jgi:hypothetical protein